MFDESHEYAAALEFSGQVTLDPGWRRERLRIVALVQHPQNHPSLGVASGAITP